MILSETISELPNTTAVYALYGGRGRSAYVAYIGIADNLRRRIERHLIARDSSVAVGTSATGINPEHIIQVSWWQNDRFDDREILKIAELVAFQVLNPALRSRGARPKNADALLKDSTFRNEMESLFKGDPTGKLNLPTLQDAIERIRRLEKAVARLEERIKKKDSS